MRADATYVVTGGLGAIGRQVARYLAGRGAEHLVLLGRSGPNGDPAAADVATPPARSADIEALREQAEVSVVRADVADAEAMAAVFEEIDAAMPPLRGIFHAAGVLDDGLLVGQSADRLAAVMAPKVRGSWTLHQLSLSRPVEHFVLFSSAAAIVGSPGQAGYAAANAFMNRLARFRRARGLPATSLCWGPWADVGLAARADQDGRLEERGFIPIAAEQGIRALDQALAADRAELAIIDVRPGAWRDLSPGSSQLPFFSDLASGSIASGGDVVAHLRAAAGPRHRKELLEDLLRREIGRVLHRVPAQIGARAPLGSLGLDSLMALELRNRLERKIGLSLPVAVVWNHPTIEELAVHLGGMLDLPIDADETVAPAVEDADEARAAEVAAMSDEDVLELLGEKLRAIDVPGRADRGR